MKKTKIILERIVDVIVLALGFLSGLITLYPGFVLDGLILLFIEVFILPIEYIFTGKSTIHEKFVDCDIKNVWLFYWFLAPGFVAALVWVDNRKERRGDNI